MDATPPATEICSARGRSRAVPYTNPAGSAVARASLEGTCVRSYAPILDFSGCSIVIQPWRFHFFPVVQPFSARTRLSRRLAGHHYGRVFNGEHRRSDSRRQSGSLVWTEAGRPDLLH